MFDEIEEAKKLTDDDTGIDNQIYSMDSNPLHFRFSAIRKNPVFYEYKNVPTIIRLKQVF